MANVLPSLQTSRIKRKSQERPAMQRSAVAPALPVATHRELQEVLPSPRAHGPQQLNLLGIC